MRVVKRGEIGRSIWKSVNTIWFNGAYSLDTPSLRAVSFEQHQSENAKKTHSKNQEKESNI